MIKEQLNTLIKEAMLSKNQVKTEAYRAIKTAIMNWETAKENVGKTYDETVENSVLKKLAAQYEDTAIQCNDGKHDDLVKTAQETANIIKDYLPAPVSEEKIIEVFNSIDLPREKKNMGMFIKNIKQALPGADGKIVSQIVAKNLN